MSGVLQLLLDYYRSVLESDRIYHEGILKYQQQSNGDNVTGALNGEEVDKDDASKSVSVAPKIANETLLLQRQLTDLTSQLQDLKRKNEALQEQQKSYRALNESKIAKFKRTIDSLKRKNERHSSEIDDHDDQINEDDSKKFDYHLLSPVAKRGLKRGLKISNGKGKGRKGTIFDSKKETFTDDESSENSIDSPTVKRLTKQPRMEHEESFLKSFEPQPSNNSNKKKNKQLDGFDIPSLNDFSRDEDEDEDQDESHGNNEDLTTKNYHHKKQKPLKKRKLTKKKIEKIGDNDAGEDSMNKDSLG
ncbi:similar to Saccharomyces cerevisiae YDR439W LRS4 Nucleolar protein that forms a complex with Csm1p [Maudiozyma saulgeensis]|uniref:Similar to Saccharomyces cerevisiae YDR439W LRS4 Nucleolar protein that forms a complex with Csm1p n=1 Tax=Maudiozyma saulgeensis TaxID=1789683 RepID=A0A1X7R5U1_9SACH|nr:similar to Saccharomyces cerevisiae YDR439W LRS4 Nucleolar protein that forms a complex with Csm1p [Kazachstania saulgeensis]